MGQSPAGEMCNTSGIGLPLLNGPTEYGDHHPTPVQYTTDARKLAKKGDILFCVRGSTTGRMNWADRDYAIGRGVAAIRHKSLSELQPLVRAVVKYHLPNLLIQATGSTFPNVSSSQLSNLPWPNLSENHQRAIAHILGTLDDKIELNRQQNETLEAMTRALFKAWFVDFEPVRAKMEGRWQRGQSLPGLPAHLYGLFPDRLVESELGEIPEGWGVGILEDMLVLQRGFDLPTKSRIEGPFPVIAAGGVNGTHHKAMVKGPGVVTGRSGVLGNVFFELGDYWPLNTTLWIKEFRAARPCYAYELLRCLDFKIFNTGSAVPTLNRNHIHVLPQIIPTSEVIGKFEELAMALHQDILTNEHESRSLAQMRDTLLPRLISGELRVPDAKRVLEEVST